MTTQIQPASFLTERVGMRDGRTAPRWVPVLIGLVVGASSIAVSAHGTPKIISFAVLAAMVLCLAVVGRRQVTRPELPPT